MDPEEEARREAAERQAVAVQVAMRTRHRAVIGAIAVGAASLGWGLTGRWWGPVASLLIPAGILYCESVAVHRSLLAAKRERQKQHARSIAGDS